MAADQAEEREQRARADAARFLRLDLVDFARDERFVEDVKQALPLFWNDLYTADNADEMSDSEETRFYDWFAFDYVLAHDEAGAGQRVIDIYRAEHGEDLNPQQAALLVEWGQAGPLSAYELTGYQKQELQLKEIVTGETHKVFEVAGHGEAPVGSLILGRIVPVDDHLEFSSMPAYIAPKEIADLREKVTAALGEDGQAENEFPDFMRRHNTLLIHHALEQAQKAGRPPVARLDPHRQDKTVRQRTRHERVRVMGPNNRGETMPHAVQTRRKAI
jgi:hypothetical protein